MPRTRCSMGLKVHVSQLQQLLTNLASKQSTEIACGLVSLNSAESCPCLHCSLITQNCAFWPEFWHRHLWPDSKKGQEVCQPARVCKILSLPALLVSSYPAHILDWRHHTVLAELCLSSPRIDVTEGADSPRLTASEVSKLLKVPTWILLHHISTQDILILFDSLKSQTVESQIFIGHF